MLFESAVPPREVRPERYWLIVGLDAVVLTVEDTRGEEALLVFSFEDEALLYLRMEELGPGWRVRETTAGELASTLLRPLAGVERIALDPLPGVLGRQTVGLLSLWREDFVRTLVCDREFRATGPRCARPAAPIGHNPVSGSVG